MTLLIKAILITLKTGYITLNDNILSTITSVISIVVLSKVVISKISHK
jgi:hypothetical protein